MSLNAFQVDSFGVEELAELCEYFLGKIKAGEVATARYRISLAAVY